MAEEMAELKIIVPARWAKFIDEFYKITGIARDEDLRMAMQANIEGFMLTTDRLSLNEQNRLVKKYSLQDIRN